jgi:hypothetical protein
VSLRETYRRAKAKIWLAVNIGPDGPRPFALRATQAKLDLNSWLCEQLGHRWPNEPQHELSGIEWCTRCWMGKRGEPTAYDRREKWLWKQRLAKAMRDSGLHEEANRLEGRNDL